MLFLPENNPNTPSVSNMLKLTSQLLSLTHVDKCLLNQSRTASRLLVTFVTLTSVHLLQRVGRTETLKWS